MSDGVTAGAVQLPRWQSHKRVWADKITGVTELPRRWHLAGGGEITVSDHLLGRVPPEMLTVGGYYVRYEDGYESWSPGDVFEDGYARVATEA